MLDRSKSPRYLCLNSTGRSNEKAFQSWLCEDGRYVLISSFSFWGALCVVHSLWPGGALRYLGAQFSQFWIWNTLFAFLLGRRTEFFQLYPSVPSPNLNSQSNSY